MSGDQIFCSQCGSPNAVTNRFCIACSAALPAQPGRTPVDAPPPVPPPGPPPAMKSPQGTTPWGTPPPPAPHYAPAPLQPAKRRRVGCLLAAILVACLGCAGLGYLVWLFGDQLLAMLLPAIGY